MRLFRTRQFYVTFKGHVYPFLYMADEQKKVLLRRNHKIHVYKVVYGKIYSERPSFQSATALADQRRDGTETRNKGVSHTPRFTYF